MGGREEGVSDPPAAGLEGMDLSKSEGLIKTPLALERNRFLVELANELGVVRGLLVLGLSRARMHVLDVRQYNNYL